MHLIVAGPSSLISKPKSRQNRQGGLQSLNWYHVCKTVASSVVDSLTHVSPVFWWRFPSWMDASLLGRKHSTGGPDGVGWRAEHCRAGSGKGPTSHVCFKKKWQDGWKMCYPLDKNLWKSVYVCNESDSSQNVRRQGWALLPKVGKWVRRVCGAWCVVRDAWNLLKIWGKVVKAVKAVSGPGGDHCLPKSGWTCLYLCDGLAPWKKIHSDQQDL